MSWFFWLGICLPSVYLYFRFDKNPAVLTQLLLSWGLLFLGTRAFRGSGLTKLLGLAMVGLGAVAYYFLIIRPLFAGYLTALSFN